MTGPGPGNPRPGGTPPPPASPKPLAPRPISPQPRYWVPLNVQRDEDGEIVAAFHPACGEYHPVVDGRTECPVWAQVNAVLAEGLARLEAISSAPTDASPGSGAAPQPLAATPRDG